MTSYTNPWHRPGNPAYGPARYKTDATPATYRGFLIFHRIDAASPVQSGAHVFDIVRGNVCITQRAGPNGAKLAIDALLDDNITPDQARLLAWSLGATEWRTMQNRKGARHLLPPLVYFTAGLHEIGHWNEVTQRFSECSREWGESVAAEHYTRGISDPVTQQEA